MIPKANLGSWKNSCFDSSFLHNRQVLTTFVLQRLWMLQVDHRVLRVTRCKVKTLPKAQRTRGLNSAYQINFFWSYHKFSNKSLSDFIFMFSTKQQLRNLNQISAFRLNLNFKILTKPRFRISTKNNLHNLNQGSAAK